MSSQIRAFANRFLWTPVDNASLALFRIAFGALTVIECGRYYFHGWIAEEYQSPKFFFKYYGFDWVNPWPGNGMIYHFWFLAAAAFLVMIGAAYRLAATLCFLGISYFFLLDETQYLNHIYLLSLFSFLLIFMPAHKLWSVDAALWPRLRRQVVPSWALNTLRAQMAIVYAFAGLAKLNGDWLSARSIKFLIPRESPQFLRDLVLSSWGSHGIVVAGLAFDLSIVPLLVMRRTRMIGFVLACGFHLSNSFIFKIGIFPWLGIAATTLFLAPDWPRRLLGKPDQGIENRSASVEARPALVTAFVTIYLLLQVLIPSRHWFYPGVTDWSDEGHRFSWRMMLRSKSGEATFWIEDKDTGKRIMLPLDEYLTEEQVYIMSQTPDMILQFSHYIREVFAQRGHPHCEVHVESQVSLNGRLAVPIIDPNVDIASQPETLLPAPWILPLKD